MTSREKAQAAVQWWRALQPDPKREPRQDRAGDRAALAKLRRCTTPLQAAFEPAALSLARCLGIRDGGDEGLDDALLAAIVLAHVREDAPEERVARQLGAADLSGHAPMSPLRLTRLLAAETQEERLVAFRRAVALLKGRLNVRDLALALLDWSERHRIEWAFAYHNVPPPGDSTETGPNHPSDGDPA